MSKLLQRASKAHELYQDLVKTRELSRLAGVKMGELLYQLRNNESYREAVGETSWDDFLKLPEIGIDKREANRSISIYEELVIKRGFTTAAIAEVPVKALHYVLPLARDAAVSDEEIRGHLDDAQNLSQAAFREALHDNRGDTRTYEFVLMRRRKETNNLKKVQDVTEEQILSAFSAIGIDLSQLLVPEIT